MRIPPKAVRRVAIIGIFIIISRENVKIVEIFPLAIFPELPTRYTNDIVAIMF